MTKFILFSFLGLSFLSLSAQMKIDTLAIDNYQIRSINLSPTLDEISSLEIHEGHYWGNNDSGGKAEIYKIDPTTGKIVQTIKITNVVNIDWEEISFSKDFVFIGDFGNNLGNRKDLAIHYFPIQQLDSNESTVSVEAQTIHFYYPEQKDFNPGNKKTNFDCEAFFFHDNKLHLFTKEWTNLATTHYTLEIKNGKQAAKKIETFPTNYMVTGASIDNNPISNTHGFYLIGYTPDGFAFISGFSLPNTQDQLLFSNKLNKFSLPLGFTATVGQVEGIAIKPEIPNIICFSNEDFKFKGFHVGPKVQCIYSLAQ